MVPTDKISKQLPLSAGGRQLDIQRGKGLHAAGKVGVGPIVGRRAVAFSGRRAPRNLFFRKPQDSLTLQTLQKIPAFPGLETSTRSLPVQQLAYRPGQFRPADPTAGAYHLLDQRYFPDVELPTANALFF